MTPGRDPAPGKPIRLLIADDSPTVRAIIRDMVLDGGGIVVAGEAANGREAISLSQRLRPDVILMDIRMPGVDGLQATEKIMASCPAPIIAFSSFAWGSESQASIDMLAAGAVDVMAKPDLTDLAVMRECAAQLRRKIRIVSRVAVVRRIRRRGGAAPTPLSAARSAPKAPYAVLGIGASSGGPAALRELFRGLPPRLPVPVLLVQHITSGFTSGFVDWLHQHTGLDIRVCAERERAVPGTVLVAPEGRQMEAGAAGEVLAASTTPRGVHIPSVDVLFSSLARAYGARAIGVILTGMGADGVEGLLEIREAGGLTIAQDEETSTVFGMPGEAIRRGAAELVLPLAEIASCLSRLAVPPHPAREESRV